MKRFAGFTSVLAIFAAMTACGGPQPGNAGGAGPSAPAEVSLLNVSYDPTREFYREFNEVFAKHWAGKGGGQRVTVKQSHAGSGGQARAVIDGLEADVVTLALAYDVDAIARPAIQDGWLSKLPTNSATVHVDHRVSCTKGNPKGIKDWGDLISLAFR